MTSLSTAVLILAAVLGAAGGLGLVVVWWRRRSTRLQSDPRDWMTVVASDTGVVPPVLLRDPLLGLRGKPDYVLEAYGGGHHSLIPLELKPTRRGRRIYESDAIQVGAYLMLLRATYGDRAGPFGYVRYSTGTFRVELTPELAGRVREVVAAIRVGRQAAVVHRNHSVSAKCAGCAMRRHCNEALA